MRRVLREIPDIKCSPSLTCKSQPTPLLSLPPLSFSLTADGFRRPSRARVRWVTRQSGRQKSKFSLRSPRQPRTIFILDGGKIVWQPQERKMGYRKRRCNFEIFTPPQPQPVFFSFYVFPSSSHQSNFLKRGVIIYRMGIGLSKLLPVLGWIE